MAPMLQYKGLTSHKKNVSPEYRNRRDKNLLKIKLEKAEAKLIRFAVLPYTYEITRREEITPFGLKIVNYRC